MSESITCGWCAEEIPAGSKMCPMCNGDVAEGISRRSAAAVRVAPPPDDPKPKAPAGWYDDPKMVNTRRYWDGQQWTEHRQETRPPPPVPEQRPDLPIILQSPAALLTPKDDKQVRTLFHWGLAMMILLPIVGLVIGIVLLGKNATWGVRVIIGSIAFSVVFAILIR